VKIKNIAAGIAVLALVLAASGTAEAKSKFHFLKSKKFWGYAAAVAVPAATSGALAAQRNGNTPPSFPNTPTVTRPKPR
jgi:hypothetical protein